MDAVLASTIDILEDVGKMPDWQHELAFTEPRHTESITGLQSIDGSWRLKERIKTVSVALVLCLNVGVDPPDVVKIEPAAHLECWFDPLSEEPQKAIEYISVQLEKQYEQWHSRARYKKCLDPTVDEVKRLCTSLRRYSKEDRVLFHYNGHGVPRPTQNGEIWVFNEKYTQYIPLAIYDLQQWMGAPSIYVFDCSCAGSIVDSFLEFANQHKRDYEIELAQYTTYQQRQILVNTHDNNILTPSIFQQQQQIQNNNPHIEPKSHSDSQPERGINGNSEILTNNNNNNTSHVKDSSTNMQSAIQNDNSNTSSPASTAVTKATTEANINQLALTKLINRSTNNITTVDGNGPLNVSSTGQATTRAPPIKPPNYDNCFHLAACEAHQILPMQPDLPADLFTSCLTTPIKTALRWFVQKNDSGLIPKVTFDLIDKIPGSLSDRKTMLGELNWIFTAITDTIAWDVLPRELFQRLYRQDLLVASLFRNFLLADRIMRTYDCTPVSHPKLPKTYHHPMWRAWDMVVDLCLSQLVDVLEERTSFKSSTFFAEQLTAFEVWLDMDHSSNQRPDHQLLPIILQVLLSPVHRLRALDLLSRFLNLGPGAVNSALSVGIFPYVLKLLQSNAREVRPFLLSIWAKILAIDRRCQVDLVRDHFHRYFLPILSDGAYDAHYRTMAAFVLTCIVRDYPLGQEVAYQAGLIAMCLVQLDDPDPMLRKWLAICLGCIWDNYDDARWRAVRDNAYEKLYALLDDSDPEVRAACVYALGTFIISGPERTEHANNINHSIGMKLVSTSLHDSSVLVRHELVVALQYLVLAFESQFIKLEQVARDEERKQTDINHDICQTYHGNNLTLTNHIPRVNSLNAIPLLFGSSSKIVSNVYHVIWKAMYTLAADPHPRVSTGAQTISDDIRTRSFQVMSSESLRESKSNSSISDSSSPNRSKRSASGSDNNALSDDEIKSNLSSQRPVISTDFVDWCTKYFVDPETNYTSPCGSNSKEDQQREWRMLKVLSYRNVCLRELMVIDQKRFSEIVSNYKIQQVPNLVVVHPYDPIMVVAGRDDFSIIHSDGPHVNDYDTSGLSSSISSASLTSSTALLGAGISNNSHHHLIQHNHQHHTGSNILNQHLHHHSNGGDGHSHDLIGTQSNCHSSSSQITSLQLINPEYNTLVSTGSSDGTVRIWKAYNGIDYSFNPQLVTAFHLMPELQPYRQGLGMILLWDQHQSKFYATSDQNDVRMIKVWDAGSESKIQDIPTCAEFGVSCLSSDGEHSIAAGFLDGSIRIYDTRLKKTDCRTFTFRKHSEKILTLHMFKPGEKHINLVSGDSGGEVRFWDKRAPTSVKRVDVGQKMSVMSVHPNADVFACGLKSGQGIKIYNLDGTSRAGCVIKPQDNNFFNSRHNPSVSCLAFHPLMTSLVAGYTDAVISVYSSRIVP